jgi:hypothetical protein
MKRKIGVIEPRKKVFIEPTHSFEHLAPHDNCVRLCLDTLRSFDLAAHLAPLPTEEMLVLAKMTNANRTADVELRSRSVDHHPAAPLLEVHGVHGRSVVSFAGRDQSVQPTLAHDRIVLDKCDPLVAGAIGS